MNSNEKTLAVYQDNFELYVSGTAQESSGVQKQWIEHLLSSINKDQPILEIGSAFGRDASLIEKLGYTNLTVSDAFPAAVDTLREKGFERVKKFNVLTDELDATYKLIFAAAVFLHFTEAEFAQALLKLRKNIESDGMLAFSVKKGDGEEWSEHKMGGPRFFHYWQGDALRETVEECGYDVTAIGPIDDSEKWLAVECRPKSL